MKRSILILICCLGCLTYLIAQEVIPPLPWNTTTKLNSYRPLLTMPGSSREFIDLDNDGDPDVMRYTTSNGFPVQWIDDDDDMKVTDTEGDTDNDCLMADLNKEDSFTFTIKGA